MLKAPIPARIKIHPIIIVIPALNGIEDVSHPPSFSLEGKGIDYINSNIINLAAGAISILSKQEVFP